MFGLHLKGFWVARDDRLTLKEGRRAVFFVVNTTLAGTIKDWLKRRYEADRQIKEYLEPLARGGAPIRPEPPWYTVDEDGYLRAINFQHNLPTHHTGWRGIPNTNWLAPEDDKIKCEIRQLAPLPSYKELCELIDWPMMPIDKSFRDMHLPGYKLFAERANRSIKVWELDGHIFLVLPFPGTFADYPSYMEKVRAWRPPAGLEQLTHEQADRIKTVHKRANSAFAKAIARCGRRRA